MNGLEKFIYKMKKYKTILIDPPWDYGKGWGYGAGEYYKLMSLKDLKNLPVGLLAY